MERVIALAVLAQFGSLQFEISSSTALLFEKLKLSSECETEEKTVDEQKYVSAKNGKPVQASFAVILSASLGIDVKEEVTAILNYAQRGEQAYFYIVGKKLFPFQMMMVSAQTEEIQTSPSGVWVYAKVNITLKQSSKEWITGQQKVTTSSSNNTSNATTGGKAKAEIKYVKPISNNLGATNSGATIYAPSSSFQDAINARNAANSVFQNIVNAVNSSAGVVSTAKSVASTVSNSQPLTAAQRSRASAKEARLLGIE